MPKVLHLYKDVFPPVYGGIEVVLGKLAEHQSARGWDVEIAVSGPVDTDWAREHRIRVHQVGEWFRLLSNPISPGFLPVLKAGGYDVLHLHLPCPTAVVSALLAGDQKAPWFVSYQSDIVRQRITGLLYSPLESAFFRKVTRIFVSSPPLMETSRALCKFQDKCQVVPLGISAEELTVGERAEGAAIRARFEGKPILLFVGRFRWYKGLHVLVEAMNNVDAVLLVIGSGTPNQVARLKAQAAGLKHPERVQFMGTVEKLSPYLAAADIFCLPSTHRAEAFGYVLLEAFRAGLPAITTELGTGTSYVNVDGRTGFVVPPKDPIKLAGAICRLLADPAYRERFALHARQRIEREFTVEKMVDSISAAYEAALARR